jgi:DNA modification methylase
VAIADSVITENYAIYHGDCMEVMAALPDASVDLSVYSPPFGGLFQYSSDEADLSNCLDKDEFFEHYAFVVREVLRLTKPGRMSAVHCADIPSGNTGSDSLFDLTGAIIRLHEQEGWLYTARYSVWKEPLGVRNRLMTKSLSHKSITLDSTKCSVASADYLVMFRKPGVNETPVTHPNGLLDYAGSRQIPRDVLHYRGWTGNQIENRYSHWIWRQYASAFWDDVRIDRVLPHRDARDEGDERHIHPLQLDVIDRALVLWSNPGETVLTPFMGVGSEVYAAVRAGRRAIGAELKPAYYRQAVLNVADALTSRVTDNEVLPFSEETTSV